jgi:hypothetical protein
MLSAVIKYVCVMQFQCLHSETPKWASKENKALLFVMMGSGIWKQVLSRVSQKLSV